MRSVLFQFTHPGKGATQIRNLTYPGDAFQFTHPGKGATGKLQSLGADDAGFNSRTLGRVRQLVARRCVCLYIVSIHAPWEGCDIIGAPTLDT